MNLLLSIPPPFEYTEVVQMQILKTRFRSRRQFLESFEEEAASLFCPTTLVLQEKDLVMVELFFPDLPNKMLLQGEVLWWRSALPRLKVRAGAQVTFSPVEEKKLKFILSVASGERINVTKRKHQRLPIELTVRWRDSDSSRYYESMLHNISIGGAMMVTEAPPSVGDEIIIELTTPGGAKPISIASKVAWHTPNGNGLKFIYRDGGGSQRLKEVVRRITSRY